MTYLCAVGVHLTLFFFSRQGLECEEFKLACQRDARREKSRGHSWRYLPSSLRSRVPLFHTVVWHSVLSSRAVLTCSQMETNTYGNE